MSTAHKKTYLITDPTGASQIVTGLKDFCSKHNLTPTTMSKVSQGKANHHKGFRCETLTK
jgi:hypothetical protein